MRALIGLIFGITLSLLLTTVAGENAFHVLSVLVNSAFGSFYDLGLTLFYTTSLIFTGLSVAMAFHVGLFNIGGEGQLTISALAIAAFGIFAPDLPPVIAPLLALSVGLASAALWGFIGGYLKAYRGSHEVIITMMLNFVAAGLASYFIVGALKNPDSQNPESAPVATNFLLSSFDPLKLIFPESPANLSLLVAIFLSITMYLFLFRTTWGFELRTVGKNEEAASVAGISVKKYQIFAMTMAGILAGFVGLNEILGSAGKFRLGFSADFGFVGIAVALLARNNPLAIIASAFLFGALQKGATDLDLETTVITKDFSKILQAIIILSVVAFSYFNFNFNFKKFLNKDKSQ